MIKITSNLTKDGVDFSIDDAENNLGVKFFAPQTDLTSEQGLAKIFDAISNYVNQNYVCQHRKTVNGVVWVDTK